MPIIWSSEYIKWTLNICQRPGTWGSHVGKGKRMQFFPVATSPMELTVQETNLLMKGLLRDRIVCLVQFH